MPSPVARFFVLPAVAALLVAGGCASDSPPIFRTTPGTEAPQVLAGLAGRVAVSHQGDGLSCDPIYRLASRQRTSCVSYAGQIGSSSESGLVAEDDRTILAMRLDVDRNDYRDRTFVLVRRRCAVAGPSCRADEQELAHWKSDAGALYRKTVAVSADGRWAAVVPSSSHIRLTGFAPAAPDGFHFADARHVGELVLLDLHSVGYRNTGFAILDEQPIAWSRDGRRLLVVRPETIDRLTPALRADLRGREGEAGRTIPVIETWDVKTGAVEMLAIGLDPLWSPDERTLLYASMRLADVPYFAGDDRTLRQDRTDAYELRDLDSGVRRPVELPGLIGRRAPIAFVGPRQVLYWAIPTVGTPPAATTMNSPLVGPKQMLALKVGDLDTQAFATVVPAIDPRAQVGFDGRP